MSTDKRIDRIKKLIFRFAHSDFGAREKISDKDDELDGVIEALNSLGDILNAKRRVKNTYDERMTNLADAVLNYAAMDFSKKAIVSEEGDELDALAVGLNTLAEELEYARSKEKKHIKELEESEERFRLLLENVKGYAIFMVDLQGNILTWNRGAEQIKGYSAKEVIRKNISIFYSDEDRKKGIPAHNLEMAGTYGRFETEGWRIRKDGTKFLANVVFTALYDSNGDLKGFVKITKDVTEEKKAESLLRESEDRFRKLFEFAPYPMWVYALDNLQFLEVNNAAVMHYGYSKEEFLSMTIKDIRPVTEVERLENNIKRRPDKIDSSKGWKHRLRSGELIDVEITSHLLDFKDQKAALVIANDITERKKAEEKILQANKFIDSILENIPNMIFVKEVKELRFVRLNKAGEKLLGYSRNDLLGKNDFDFFPKEQAEFFIEKDRLVIEKREAVDIPEEPIDTKHGKRLLHTKKITITDEKGSPLYLLGISEDITERKKAEVKIILLNKELENAKNELEIKVEQRTASLERSNQELRDYTHIISHDLKAPLRAIGTLADILLTDYQKILDNEGQQKLQLIKGRAVRLDKMINSILEYSQVGQELNYIQSVDLNKLVPEIVRDSHAPENIRIAFKNRLPKIECNQKSLEQIFKHLISNAIKYNDKENGLIEIGCVEQENDWQFFISDNGKGISEQFHKRIFNVFQTLSPRDIVEGTGMGLAIVKKVIDFIGGKIWVTSKEKQGSTFYFTVPKLK